MSPEPLVRVEEVHAYYGKSHVLHGVSLEVGRGEIVGLLGRNGVGKSTTLKTILGHVIDVLHREGVAVLLVEQNVPLTIEACQRIYIIEKGVVRHHAPASELRADDAIIHQYLGV